VLSNGLRKLQKDLSKLKSTAWEIRKHGIQVKGD